MEQVYPEMSDYPDADRVGLLLNEKHFVPATFSISEINASCHCGCGRAGNNYNAPKLMKSNGESNVGADRIHILLTDRLILLLTQD